MMLQRAMETRCELKKEVINLHPSISLAQEVLRLIPTFPKDKLFKKELQKLGLKT
jgi:hypothetical protein